MGTFVSAFIREAELLSPRVKFSCDTLYLGGGTPSVLTIAALEKIMESLYRCFDFTNDAEISLEANPGTITAEKLSAFRSMGINRINIGVQSFQHQHLRFLGRIHSAGEAVEALGESGKFFDNTGLDLIYGLPGQSEKAWKEDLEKSLTFAPAHLSCYLLTYEKGTALTEKLHRGHFLPLADEKAARLLEFTVEFLDSRGYAQYEISNFARSPDLRSRHNCKYWSSAPYAGLGPAAHSFFPPQRQWNVSSLEKYIRSLRQNMLPLAGKEILNREQQMTEAIYLGLRKREGIGIPDFEKKFSLSFENIFGKTAKDLVQRGLLEKDAARCALSFKGLRFLDSITSLLADCCPESAEI